MKGIKCYQFGNSRLGVLLFILLVVVLVYAGSQVFPFFYYYHEIKGLMEAQAEKAQVLTDEEIRRSILDRVRKLELPIDEPERALKVNRYRGKIVISLKYQEVLYFEFGDKVYNLWVFEFNPHVERDIEGYR